MSKFNKVFLDAIPELRKSILNGFSKVETQSGYRSVWEDFEELINPILIDFLMNSQLKIPRNDIVIARSKSVYPDMKVKFQGKEYAIDVKSGEDGRNPWYDMGRLDTYEKTHLNKYDYEYYITVRWKNHDKPEVINVYIEPAYQSTGFHKVSKGILFRPYDGKIRPKSWQDFDSGKSYWIDKESFITGFLTAKIYRRMMYMAEWYKEMNEDQRKEINQAYKDIEDGKDNALLGKLRK